MGPRQVVKSAEDKLSEIFDIIANTDERRTRARKEAWEAVKRVVLDIEDEVKPKAESTPDPAPVPEPAADITTDVTPSTTEPAVEASTPTKS